MLIINTAPSDIRTLRQGYQYSVDECALLGLISPTYIQHYESMVLD